MWFNSILLLGCTALLVSSQEAFKVCSTDRHSSQCTQLQRGKSEVQCQWVQDSIECAKRLMNETADFGVFSAESALHLGVLNWDDLVVIRQLKHQDRVRSNSEFESVVVVRKDHQAGLEGLRGKKFCHPGFHYSKNQKWTERFLKHFERTVVEPKCQINKSPAEIEVSSLSTFFGDSCRPGVWSHDVKEDLELKRKYPSLCSLCPVGNCKYNESADIEKQHQWALNCLKNGGDVAYVSREDAELFFAKEGSGNDFRYLCTNGSLETVVDNKSPCTWLRQPWKVIIGRRDKALVLEKKIDPWLQRGKEGLAWESELREILGATYHEPRSIVLEKPNEYIRTHRPVPLPEQYCNTEISWCTVTEEEREKCSVARAGGISAGVYPLIVCRSPTLSVVNCLEEIGKNNSDFMGIDTNYGWLARKVYNLTPAMYFETEYEQYSSVVIVVHAESKIRRLEDLRGKKACLPEFGASSSFAFINLAKERKIFKQKECRYGHLMKDFFGESCVPGAGDFKHMKNKDHSLESMCALCLKNVNNKDDANVTQSKPDSRNSIGTCAADEGNKYYGNRGALRCLRELGEVAILELQSLKKHAEDVEVDDAEFRILCRNGSLANENGFDVDLNCALTTIVDGEVVVHRGSPKASSVVHGLNALDLYFQIDPDFKIYNIYNSERNLLFQDSTLGLAAVNEDNHGQMVENYINLFRDLEKCVDGSSAIRISFNILTTLLFTVFASYLIH